ncbi:hypothetical protein LguiA_005537 [Lonicera macranthoides]
MCRWKPQQLGGDAVAALVTLREKLDNFFAIYEIMAKNAISLLNRAIERVKRGNIFILVARSVRDMLFSALVESGQENRRKKRHDTSTTPSASTSPTTTAPRALSASTIPPISYRKAQLQRGNP